MAMGEQLDRVQATPLVAQPVSIDPRQAGREKNEMWKKRRRRLSGQSPEETLDDERDLRESRDKDDLSHIDYHA